MYIYIYRAYKGSVNGWRILGILRSSGVAGYCLETLSLSFGRYKNHSAGFPPPPPLLLASSLPRPSRPKGQSLARPQSHSNSIDPEKKARAHSAHELASLPLESAVVCMCICALCCTRKTTLGGTRLLAFSHNYSLTLTSLRTQGDVATLACRDPADILKS